MSVYRHKPSGRWMWEFDRYLAGKRVRLRKLLPAGFTRAQAEAFDRKESAALWAVASGSEKPRWLIGEAVSRWNRERAGILKHGGNVTRELAHMADWYEGRALDELPTVCREYATDQAGALAPATIRNRIAYLRAACRWAWKVHGLGETDPGARVTAPPVRNSREVFVSRAEMLGLCRKIDHRGVRAAVRCLWYSGMRLGELRAALRVPGAFVLPDTKNGSPRIVPMHPRIRAAAAVPMPNAGALYYWWGIARQKCGLPDVTLHTLRHSAASEMLAAGVGLDAIGKVLGHKSRASTMRYAHWQLGPLADAVSKIGRRRA
jgi:integrase